MRFFIIPLLSTIILSGCVVNPYPYNESYNRTEFYAPENSTLIYHETNVYPQNNYNYYNRPYNHNRPYIDNKNNHYNNEGRFIIRIK